MSTRLSPVFSLILLASALLLSPPKPGLALTTAEREALDNAAIADRGNADNAAVQMGSFVTGVMGSKEQLNSRFGQPVIDNTPLFNFSDNVSGTARLKCESTERFLSISYAVGAGGNINITIRQDLDLDGTYDIPYPGIGNVAGVCVNGLAFCDPGWTNCQYRKWSVDNAAAHPAWEASAVVATDNSDYGEMGGCICYSDSCAPGGVPPFPHGQSYIQERILTSLGAGVVAMLSDRVPGYNIGGATLGSYEIVYSGSNKATCDGGMGNLKEDPAVSLTAVTGGYGGTGRSDAFLSPIYSVKNASDSATDNSAWYQLNNMSVITATTTPCTIEHTVVVSTSRDTWCSYSALYAMTTQPCFNYYVNFQCAADGRNATITVGNYSCCGDLPYTQTYYLPTLPGNMHMNGAAANSHTWYTDFFGSDGPVYSSQSATMLSTCPAGFPCSYEFNFLSLAHYPASGTVRFFSQGTLKDTVNLVVSKNGCKQLEKDTTCTIWNEKVDGGGGGCTAGSVYDSSVKKCVDMTTGVYTAALLGETTVKNGVLQPGVVLDITGHRVPPGHTPVCLAFPGYLVHSVCEDLSGFKDTTTGVSYVPVGTPPYWRVDREYRCSTDNTEDMSQIWARLKGVQNSTTDVSGIGQYQDTPVGGVSIADQSAFMKPFSDNCVRRCKVQLPTVEDTQETGGQNTKQTGTTSAGTKSTTTVSPKVLRDCKRVGGALNPTGVWECPVNLAAGEIVIPIGGYECACVSDGFGRAAGDMVNLRDIANDLTCTAP